MPVDKPDVIDFIGVDRDTGAVTLAISDHLPWHEPAEHLRTLQAKLNRYLAFVEGGELLEAYPSAVGREVQFLVVFQHQPPAVAEEFLRSAAAITVEAGCALSWKLLPVSA